MMDCLLVEMDSFLEELKASRGKMKGLIGSVVSWTDANQAKIEAKHE
jgi:hypothetical protein